MRKIYFVITTMLVLPLITFNTTYGQNIANYSISFPPSVNCNDLQAAIYCTGLIDSNFVIETIWGDGISTNSSVNQVTNIANAQHSYLYAGNYTIKHLLKHYNQRLDSVIYPFHYGGCNYFYIRNYFDNNTNCLFDDGIDASINSSIQIQIDSANIHIDTMTVTTGLYYSYNAPVGTVYKFTVIGLQGGMQVICPGNGVIADTVQAIVNENVEKDFGFSCGTNTNFDLVENINVITGRHHAHLNLIATNNYCINQGATLTVNFTPKYNFQSAWPPPTSVNGSTLTWNFANLSVYTPININADFEVPAAWLLEGDTVMSSYYLTPTTGDLNPANNVIIHCDTITGSYDPNYKDVMPKGDITAGTKLTYIIEFENTGNDTALNIYILDTLSGNVLPKTMDILTSSAPMDFSLNKIPSGQYVAKFDFPNINLLDSSHHGQCTGMVVYTINTSAGLPFGTYIPNKAGIYFDDNEVVMTNTAVNRIGFPEKVNTLSNNTALQLYPNPVNDILTITTDAKDYNSLEVNNTIGQVVIKQKVTQADTKVNVKGLPSGIYTITLKGENGTKTLKFEKL